MAFPDQGYRRGCAIRVVLEGHPSMLDGRNRATVVIEESCPRLACEIAYQKYKHLGIAVRSWMWLSRFDPRWFDVEWM